MAGLITQVKQKKDAVSAETVAGSVTQYAAHGAVEQMSLGAGLVSETSFYDAQRQQLRRLSASKVAGGTWLMKMMYCPGVDESAACTSNNGNVLRQEGSVPGLSGAAVWSYAYDSLNRLWSAVETLGGTEKWHQTMKYDPYGNRSVVNDAGTLLTQELATPRVSALADPSPFDAKNRWTGADYDFAGQQKTSWGDGSAVGSAKYFYDAEGKMNRTEVRWTSTSSGAIDYGYDGEGRRVLKKVGGAVKTAFVYDAMGQLVAEYGESGAMPCTSCYLTADHLGSTRVIWGQDGVMKKLLDYAPFGEEVGANYRANDPRYPGGVYPRDGGMGVPVEFTGKERDGETGLDYFGARYMSAAQGRFATADAPFADQFASDPQSWNLYGYVRNNPLVFVDPTGAYLCSSSITSQQCDAFEQGRLDAQTLADGLKKKHGVNSREYKEAQRAIDALGTKGKDNGVTVAVGAIGHRGGQVEAGHNGVRLTIDNSTLQSGGSVLAVTIAHEGVHTADASDWIRSKLADKQNPTAFDTEFRAFKVTLDLFGQVGMPPYGDSGVLMTPGFPSSISDPQIEKYLAKSPAYSITRQNPGPKFDPKARVNRK